MSKQDRQGARTPAQLEQKYNFGQSFAEIMGIATDARTAADEAKEAAKSVDENLTPEEIFNRLTDNGNIQGIYRGDDGNIYVNASYILTGELNAALVKVINLIAEEVHAKDQTGVFVDISQGVVIAGTTDREYFALRPISAGSPVYMLSFANVDESGNQVSGSMSWNTLYLGSLNQDNAPFRVVAESDGRAGGTAYITLPSYDRLGEVVGLYAYWKNNGDGTYSIVGTPTEQTGQGV